MILRRFLCTEIAKAAIPVHAVKAVILKRKQSFLACVSENEGI